MHLYKIIFSASRYLALTASVKIRIGSPKTARKEQGSKSHTGSKFSKNLFEQLYTGWVVVVQLRPRDITASRPSLASSTAANRLQARGSHLPLPAWPGTVVLNRQPSSYSRR